MSTIVLGVTGGVAAYRAIDITRTLVHEGHQVHVVMTRAAERFVGAASFATLSGHPVGRRVMGPSHLPDYRHLDLGRLADVMLIAPATAHTIARLAAGFADDLLTAAVLAYEGPVVVAPAMNTRMWQNPATQDNVATLRNRGVTIVPPLEGLLADGDVGPGRLANTPDIVTVTLAAAGGPTGRGALRGRRVLVTAGGTREPIDAVRFVGNRSSGRMGMAVARAARRRGARVTVIAANVDLPRDPAIRYVDVERADQLLDATRTAFAECDVLIMAAAVADFRPAENVPGKIDKSARSDLDVRMEPTVDILTTLADERTDQVVVGFAAEHGEVGLARARDKLVRKRLDMIVHNDVSVPGIGFEGDANAVTIIGPGDAETTVGPTSKDACAEAIVDHVAAILDGQGSPKGV